MKSTQDIMNDSTELAVRQTRTDVAARDDAEPAKQLTRIAPAIDVSEGSRGITLYADLPGVARERLKVTSPFPVRQCATSGGDSNAYMAIMHIRRADQTVVDRHLRHYAQGWASAHEVRRNAVEYAIRATSSGSFADTGPLRLAA